MSSPVRGQTADLHDNNRSSEEEDTFIGDDDDGKHGLRLNVSNQPDQYFNSMPSPSQNREQESRLDDDLAMLQAERVVSNVTKEKEGLGRTASLARSRSRRTEPVDEFDLSTNPVHETAIYRPPENPTTTFSKAFKKIHNSSFLVRYFMYISPLAALLLIPLLFGIFLFTEANVGGVRLEWFSIWLEIVWLTLWAGRITAKMIPWPLGLVSSLFTNNSKKWRDMGKQLEIPLTLFFWWLAVEISFLPIMQNRLVKGYDGSLEWQKTCNRIIISVLIAVVLNLVEKIIIQLIDISFHLRTYADRIEINKFQIASLVKLYSYSKEKITMEDSDFEDHNHSGPGSGARTPMQLAKEAQKNFTEAFQAVGEVGAKVAGDFTGKQVKARTHPNQVVLVLLNSNSGSQVLARRLYRTFIRDGEETVFSEDMRPAFDNDEEADAAFTMFDKDLNGDISMEELEAVCVEIGRERKSITASLKDLDSVVSKLDAILLFIVAIITVLSFITLISTSAAGVLTSLGSSVLALSWLFSATAQEFLQSVIFVFVKHPFDVGDRVTIYGNTGAQMKGDDYFVKEISLLYTEFKKMEGHIVQAPNSYLNTLFILNMRRTGGLAEAVPLVVKFGTTLDQIDELRMRLLEFVKAEKREFQANVLTEIRDVTEAYSMSLNIVFFYKSNWQNELLRLQRRNKFISALCVFIQEVGIEGPLMRLPGQKSAAPFYVQYNGDTMMDAPQGTDDGPGPRSGSLNRQQQHSSILRKSNSNNRGASRARGESVSSLAKRVDFSLGMKGVVSSDIMGDVYDDGPRQRKIPDIARKSASRSRPRTIEEAEDDDQAAARSATRDVQRSHSRFRRSSMDSDSNRKNPSEVHRNRFFGHKHNDQNRDGEELSLMESGMLAIPESGHYDHDITRIDPRTGTVGPQAVRMSTESSNGGEGPSDLSWETRTSVNIPRDEQFEMRNLER